MARLSISSKRFAMAAFALLCLVFAAVATLAPLPAAFAQSNEEADRSYLVGLLEDQLSTPNRQFRINNIQGVLSSDATIGEITIADREGVWLRITNARIVWTRSALLLGRLSIDTLGAERIDVLRQPLPEEGAPPPEAGSFQVPELPVSVNLGALDVQRVVFGPTVFGLASEIRATGRLQMADGSLDTALDVTRLDGPGGTLTLAATYANASRELNLDLKLDEPANGVVANLLGVEGRPPMALALQGAGPLDTLDLNLTLDAEQQRVLTGLTQLRRQQDGLGFTANLEGPIARLVAPAYRAFFGGNTVLTASGVSHDAGGFDLQSLNLNSGALELNATAGTAADGFLNRLTLDAEIADANAGKVVLPVAGGETTVQRAALKLNFGEGTDGRWTGRMDVNDLTTTAFSADTLDLTLGGLAQNLDQPTQRRITFGAYGGLSGIISERADVAEALGKNVGLGIDGDWQTGQPINLTKAELAANGLALNLAGTIAEAVFNGTIAVDARSIAPFSTMANRELKGGLDLDARGTVTPIGGGFDLTLDGTGSDLGIGSAAADALMSGETRLTGRVARGEQGLIADRLRIFNDRVELSANGRIASKEADFTFNAALNDLALLSEKASGRLTAQGRAVGVNEVINLTFDAAVPDGTAVGRTLRDSKLNFDGALRGSDIDGKITGDGFIGGERISLSSTVATAGQARRLSGLEFSAGGTKITGDLNQNEAGLIVGKLDLQGNDISTAAALLLREATGSLNATVELVNADGKQNATVNGRANELTVDGARVGEATVAAQVADLFNVPVANGNITARNIAAGGVEIATLDGTAQQQGTTTNFDAKAALTNGADITTAGSLAPEDGGYRLKLDNLGLTQGPLAARLVEPTSALVKGSNVTLDRTVFDVGGGRIEARGSVAETLDLNLVVNALPLAIANAVKPDLALGGLLNATARVSGTRAQPEVAFDVSGRTISAAQLRAAGLSTLTVDARGTSTASRLNLDASVTSPEGLRAAAQGAVPLDGGEMAMDVNLQAFPLAVLNAVAPGQDISGNVTGTARLTGRLADPIAAFDMRGSGIGAAPLNEAGLSPLTVTANGRFADNTVALNAVEANGPQGFTLTARGTVPVTGNGLDVSLNGQAPLSLANRFLAERGTQASGTVSLSGRVSGSTRQPVIQGMVSTVGAQVVDPEANLRLNDIAVMASIDGTQITIRNASGALAGGGTVSASGNISTNAGAGFPTDIRISLNQARYADGNMLVATVNGALTLTGPLTRDPTLGGNIDVVRAEISVPDSLGGAASIDVKHKNASAAVRETLRRAKANDGTPTPTARPSVLRLNIRVNAANQIFVRGRGLDAELGGSVTLTGPATDIQPVGGFRMIRGRLGILGQRITFDEGEVTLVGDLDPFIDFVARSEGEDITVFINVRGRVSDLEITFSSEPQLPQDEVLARLIFKRGINELSPLQIAQLAAAAAELAGGGNSSLLGSLRDATGLDDLDVVTDSEGNAAVRAGRYIQENVYLGVEAGSGGTARGTINLDITEELKAKGSVGSDGDSSVGIFFEKDY